MLKEVSGNENLKTQYILERSYKFGAASPIHCTRHFYRVDFEFSRSNSHDNC